MEIVESVKMKSIPKKGRDSFLGLNILTILPLENALSLRFFSRDTLFLGILSVRRCVHPEEDNLLGAACTCFRTRSGGAMIPWMSKSAEMGEPEISRFRRSNIVCPLYLEKSLLRLPFLYCPHPSLVTERSVVTVTE
jgi:hypothetical protein